MSYTAGRKKGHASECVIALQSIGRKMGSRASIPFSDIETVKNSQAANYCAILEVMFGAGYKSNHKTNAYEVS